MKRFEILYLNPNSEMTGEKFTVHEIEGEPDYYFISDGKEPIREAKLRKEFCTQIPLPAPMFCQKVGDALFERLGFGDAVAWCKSFEELTARESKRLMEEKETMQGMDMAVKSDFWAQTVYHIENTHKK